MNRRFLILPGLLLLLVFIWSLQRFPSSSSAPKPENLLATLAEFSAEKLVENLAVPGDVLLFLPPERDDSMAEENQEFMRQFRHAVNDRIGGNIRTQTWKSVESGLPVVSRGVWQNALRAEPGGILILDAAPPRKWRQSAPKMDHTKILCILPGEEYPLDAMLAQKDLDCAIVKRETNLVQVADSIERFYKVLP